MKTTLYLGLHAPAPRAGEHIVHHPIIKIVPRPAEDPAIQQALSLLPIYTHIILTSQSAAALFFEYAAHSGAKDSLLDAKTYVAVGRKTAEKARSFGAQHILTAEQETAEGVTKALESCDLKEAFFFWPHSALSRPVIKDWLEKNHIAHRTCAFYDTIANPHFAKPDLAEFDEIVFTSPSTVDAFLFWYKALPMPHKMRSIGPITEAHLKTQCARLTPA